MKAILIKPDGSVKEVKPAGKDFTLPELYKLVDCFTVEHVQLVEGKESERSGVEMWVDEEGKLKGLPEMNHVATNYFLKAYPPKVWTEQGMQPDIVVGNALIVDWTGKWL